MVWTKNPTTGNRIGFGYSTLKEAERQAIAPERAGYEILEILPTSLPGCPIARRVTDPMAPLAKRSVSSTPSCAIRGSTCRPGNEADKTVVLALWRDGFHYSKRPAVSYRLHRAGVKMPDWMELPGNRTRLGDLQWAKEHCDGCFRVVSSRRPIPPPSRA